jgi:hypothetical protein
LTHKAESSRYKQFICFLALAATSFELNRDNPRAARSAILTGSVGSSAAARTALTLASATVRLQERYRQVSAPA